MAVTIIDVAKEVGKSYQTVSRALNNHPRISESTRRMVREAADRLGYHPSFAGKSLSCGRTMTVRCVIADLSNPFNAQFVLEVQRECRAREYDVIITDYGYDPVWERNQFQRVLSRDCDGVIGQVTDFASLADVFGHINASGIPAVILGDTPGRELVAVGVVAGAACLPQLEYLASLGHREIVFAVGGHDPHVTGYVCANFAERMKSLGLPFTPERNLCIGEGRTVSLPESGYRCGLRLAMEYPHATAVAAVNDAVACGVLRAFRESGIRVPRDISLIGQDNIWTGQYAETALTTYDLNLPGLARAAVETLFAGEVLQGGMTVQVPGRLVVRESVAAPRHG